jgi:hypothetical protein
MRNKYYLVFRALHFIFDYKSIIQMRLQKLKGKYHQSVDPQEFFTYNFMKRVVLFAWIIVYYVLILT